MARPHNPWEFVEWIVRIAVVIVRLIVELSKLHW
jgi:hypothetical protein